MTLSAKTVVLLLTFLAVAAPAPLFPSAINLGDMHTSPFTADDGWVTWVVRACWPSTFRHLRLPHFGLLTSFAA